MKLKKRIDNGLNGFHVAAIPRAPRSIRVDALKRRAQLKKTEEDGQICAFELLASLARKLLQESESSSSSNVSGNDLAATGKGAVQDRHQLEDKPLKKECIDQGSCEESVIVSQSVSQNCDQKCSLNEFPLVEDDNILERSSKVMDSVCLGKIGGDTMYKSNTATGNFLCKVEGGFPNVGDSGYNAVENLLAKQLETEGLETGGRNSVKMCNSRDPTELCMSFPALIKSDRDVKLPSYRSHVPNASFSSHRNAIKLGCRDDDDNLSRSNKLSDKLKVYRPVTRIGDRRIRKLLTSKYWKVAPKLKDFELSRADGGMKSLYHKRKTCCNYERYQRDALCKRRKFYYQNSVETFDGGFSSESVTNSPEKGRNVEKRGLASMLQGASGMTSSVAGHQASLHSKDSNVRFSIKSFKVPEIFIEVSETATVASLKRTVMDAVNAILGGGLRIGVVLHGKKIRDDNRTLSQTGISSEDSLDTLGFTLEPSPVQAPASVCSEDPPLLLPCDTPPLLTGSPVTPALDSAIPNVIPDPSINQENHLESNHDPMIPHTDILTDTTLPDSRALVAVPAMNVQALAVVPVSQKSRRSDIVQRRTRRPFSVSEVEALVQAVEELGTGRWRDVKLRSFENADHRTYVDLKDKWKTLVHTARISPQQRRGEPVPQELLDRVLAAHAYWSQHQAKQQGKHQPGILKIEAQADSNGVTGN